MAGNERVTNTIAGGMDRSVVGSASVAEKQGDTDPAKMFQATPYRGRSSSDVPRLLTMYRPPI
jgi:hypothetical protein